MKEDYYVLWYNLDQVVKEDGPIKASSAAEAEMIANQRYPVNARPAAVCSATPAKIYKPSVTKVTEASIGGK